jgi:hypothetical protein
MTILSRRDLNPNIRSQRLEIEAGGRWVAFGRPDPGELVAEVRRSGIKSLETQHADLSYLRELPQLEFLVVGGDPRDVEPVHDLPNLRSLFFAGTYGGRIDFGRLPRLELFAVNECPKTGGGLDSLAGGHDRLEVLSVARCRFTDLSWLSGVPLRTLDVSGGLTSLVGAAALAPTLRRLSLDSLPNMTSLDGIEALSGLESISISALRHVTTLDWVARLPRLRLLDVFQQKTIDSLRPLADHPALEFVTFGRVTDLDLEPLGRIPHLKAFLTGRYRWNRELSEFPYLHDLPPDDPARREYTALVNG